MLWMWQKSLEEIMACEQPTLLLAANVLMACLKCDSLIWYLARNLSFLNRKPD